MRDEVAKSFLKIAHGDEVIVDLACGRHRRGRKLHRAQWQQRGAGGRAASAGHDVHEVDQHATVRVRRNRHALRLLVPARGACGTLRGKECRNRIHREGAVGGREEARRDARAGDPVGRAAGDVAAHAQVRRCRARLEDKLDVFHRRPVAAHAHLNLILHKSRRRKQRICGLVRYVGLDRYNLSRPGGAPRRGGL